MRTAIAAGFAALVVIAAVAVGWRAVDSRLSAGDDGPTATMDAFVAALSTGSGQDVAATVRSGGDELAAAVDGVAAALPGATWTVERGAVEQDGATADATLVVTLASEFGPITWESEVTATRRRGDWGIDADPATLHPDLSAQRQVVVERTEVTRASLLAVDGEPLTSHGGSRSIGIAPERIVNEERLVTTWAQVLPDSLEDLQELLARADLQPSWYYPLVTVSDQRYDEIWPRLRSVPGVLARDASDATPSDGGFADHVLGRVGQPTAEQAADLGVPTDAVVGLNGLERFLEADLVGSEQVRVVIVDDRGNEVAELVAAQDDPSGAVATTLDRQVQQAVENALVGVTRPTAVVVVDATDGGIRASASRPLNGYNRAWEGNYPPGDAFLPVAAEALLRGDVTLGQAASCPARDAVVGAAFNAPTPADDTTVGDALAAGCDTTLARLVAATLDADDLLAAAERFGFGLEPEMPLPAATPQAPVPVDTTELVRAAAGQARVLASPLHLASVVAAASEGTWVAPSILRDAPPGPTATLSGTAVDDLRELLARGGASGGSAAGFDALGAGGFVGTAPVTGEDAVHAWAVGVVDGLGFAVLVEDTGGAVTAARRIAEQFLRELAALRG